MLRDLRFAARALWRSPASTIAAALTLALGVGVNAAVFSAFESILLAPLPYPHGTRLVSIAETNARGTRGVSAWIAHMWTGSGRSLETVGLYTDGQLVMTGDGEPEVFRGQRVNAGFFDALGVQPRLGRLFTTEDDRPPRAAVVVLTYDLWVTRFGADPAAVGRTITLNGAPHRIIGVLDRAFQPLRMNNPAEQPRIFAPLGYGAAEAERCRDCWTFPAVGLLAPGVSIEVVRSDLRAQMRQLHEAYPGDVGADADVQVEPLHERLTASLKPALVMALAAAGFVLLIACANLANLQLARAAARAPEFAVRGALGGTRGRLAREVLVESLLVAVAGCAAGLILGRVCLDLLVSLAPRELPRLGEVALDARVLLAATAAGLLTAMASSVAPAWIASSAAVEDALKCQAARIAGGRGSRMRGALVVVEVALAFVLVTATGLLVRTVSHLLAVDAGFDAGHVLTMTPVFSGTGGMAASEALQEKRAMVDAIRALPGVTAAAMVNEVPLANTTPIPCEIEGRPAAAGDVAMPNVFWVEGNYFDALRIPLIRGRLLAREDGPEAPAVLVSESFARRRFPAADPIGRRIRLDVESTDTPWLTIVGIVGDVRNEGLDRPADEAVYQPVAMNPFHYSRIVARAGGDPWRLDRPIRDAIRRIDPVIPVFHAQPMQDYVASSMAQRRFALSLMTAFGALALALAAIGLYGVLAYTVTLRTPELGVRAALGATPMNLLALVAARGLALVGAGLASGVLLSFWTTRTLSGLLFDVTASDPTTFAGAAAVIALVGLAACSIPARRAANVDPLSAIRS